ncbi:putative cilia-and flagella-associated protein [Dioscorea sansibarensis]
MKTTSEILSSARSRQRELRMVVIHVKSEGDEEKQFLYDCLCSSTIDEIAQGMLDIADLQSHILTLSLHLRRYLLTDHLRESYPDFSVSLDRTLSEAQAYASKDQVLHKRALSYRLLRDHIRCIGREVQVARSMGLVDDNLPQLLTDDNLSEGTKLWWAGKELSRGKRLSEYIGDNEKTKIIVTLKPAHSSS